MTEPNWEEQSDEIEIDLRYYAHLIKSNWLIIVSAAIGAALVAYIASQFLTSIYRSQTTLYIDASRQSSGTLDLSTQRLSAGLADTYAEMLTSRSVLEKVVTNLGDDELHVAGLRGAISANPVGSTQLLRIQVEDSSPQRAADIANELTSVFASEITEIQTSGYIDSLSNYEAQLALLDEKIEETERQLATLVNSSDAVAQTARLDANLIEYNSDYNRLFQSAEDTRLKSIEASSTIRQIDVATAAVSPIRPRRMMNTAVGLILGLMASVGFIFAKELLDDTVKNPDEISKKFGIPILGQILNFAAENETLITALDPRSPASEAFRSLRLNLKYSSVDKPIRSLLVTSPSPSEGKSTTATNLSIVLGQGGQEVIVIDGDLRKPKVHKTFGLPNRSGMSDLFIESVDALPEMLQKYEGVENLSILVSGPMPPNPSELLDSDKAKQIIQAAADSADFVMVDAPPVVAMTDALALSQHVDGVIVVIRAGSTKRSAVDMAVGRLRSVNANLLGFVITDIDNFFKNGSYYYQNYYDTYYKAYAAYETDVSFDDEDDSHGKMNGKVKSKSRLSQLFSMFTLRS